MAAKRKQPKFKIGQTVRTLYYIPGTPFGISAEMAVVIHDATAFRAPEEPRYRVSHNGGNRLWVYESVLEPLDTLCVDCGALPSAQGGR